jgi:RHS repeat-associated protein
VPNYNYNVSNKLTSNSNGRYTYDANGNTLADASGKSYTWDFENRLTQATVPTTGTTTFRYDPFGRRIQKSGPLGTTNYLYDGFNSLEEIDQNGNVLARYAQTTNTDEPLAEFRSGTTSYYQQDAIGSVSSLSNATGALANSYTYDAFGKLTASTGTLANPFQYTGREFDPETGMYGYRARYYDQNTGRFTSEDPLSFGGGNSNMYAYVGNNSTDFIDPFGLTNCVVTPLGTVCSDWNTSWSWMEPKPPHKPPLPDELAPSLIPGCDCAKIRKETRDKQLREIGKELGITVAVTCSPISAQSWV